MKPVRVALLGATSHIAKGLIASFLGRDDYELLLYARSPERVGEFIASIGAGRPELLPLSAFGSVACDVIINCIGIGDPGKLRGHEADIFSLTEQWDSAIINHLSQRPETLYINFSSGAAYGGDFSHPVNAGTRASFTLNRITPADYYGIAKLHSEARHRAVPDLHIVDLRVFSYFSRHIDLATRFLLTDIATALKNGSELQTTSGDIVRDYVHPEDLAAMVTLCINRRKLNEVYDVYSLKPVGKFEMLEIFSERFGLRYRTVPGETVSATGKKERYYSTNHHASDLGYIPAYSSLESLCHEMGFLLSSV